MIELVIADNRKIIRGHQQLVALLNTLPSILEAMMTITLTKHSTTGKRAMNWLRFEANTKLMKIALKSWVKCQYHTKLQNSDKTREYCCLQVGMILAIFLDLKRSIPPLFQILHAQTSYARKLPTLFQTHGAIMGICWALQSGKGYLCSQIKMESISKIWHRLMGFCQTLVRQRRQNLLIQKHWREILLSTVAQTQISNAIQIGMPWQTGLNLSNKTWQNPSTALDTKRKKAATSWAT